MNSVKESVKIFYNAQSKHFSQTRKKPWPEFVYIKNEVSKLINKRGKIKILELGCGSGRLYKYLVDSFGEENIDYIGVDISSNLIQIAKKENPKAKFEVDDMLKFLEKQEQQSFDFVVAVASFQHINKKFERLIILKNIYRILDYNGIVMMFNWSFSKWFFKKYKKPILKTLFIFLLSIFTKPINDIYIPWKAEDKVYYRYYHIFFLSELVNLFKMAGFVVLDTGYITREGIKSVSWQDSRNSMIIAKKSVTK